MITKLILPGSQDFGISPTQMIKSSSSGLRGNDLHDFVKRAGAKAADAMQKLSFAPGEVPIHLIAIGSTEFYSINRNGDGFTEACCRKYHPTFEKHARWYHDHQNKDTSKSYGIIKKSMYNEDMHRLELIVALNGTKEAARRNKGLVATEELEKLAAGKDMAVSMAARVPHDVCLICNNKAVTRADYCTGIEEGGSCEGGGCKNNMCKVGEDGRITGVDNPITDWFDISKVFRPADRIAYVFGKLEKSASSRILGGAELADLIGLTTPIELTLTDITDKQVRNQIKIACELADIESDLHNNLIKTGHNIPNTRTTINGIENLARDDNQRPQILKALAREKIALSLIDFIKFSSSCDHARSVDVSIKVQPYLRNIFTTLTKDTIKLAQDIATNPFIPTSKEPLLKWQIFATKQAAQASLDIKAIEKRAWKEAIREEPVVVNYTTEWLTPNDNDAYAGIAQAYALYKLAFLNEIRDSDPNFQLTENLVIRQNHIS